jgi:hypothetical protein
LEAIKVRRFFESYAKSKSLDPLLATSWYNLTLDAIKEYPVCIEERKEGQGREMREKAYIKMHIYKMNMV